MAEKDDLKKQQEDNRRFKEALLKVIGDTVRKPIAAKLGYKNSAGIIQIKVPDTRTDQPDKYYFHEAGGTSFQGEAFLKSGTLERWQQRFGTPIYIEKHPLSGEWEIVGLDTRYANQFFSGGVEDEETIQQYRNLAPGLLQNTTPDSMQAKVLLGSYRIGNSWYYVPTQDTIDWSISPNDTNVPTTNLKAKLALVQVEPITGTLEYKYGAEFPSNYSFQQVDAIDTASTKGTYVPQPDNLRFKSGYVKLIANMTKITRQNVWAVQDYLTLSSADSILNNIVTADGDVVVDRVTGNVVFT